MKKLKPFNLEEAKAGKPVCLRDGRPARIVCFDYKPCTPIVTIVTNKYGTKSIFTHTIDGIYGHSFDLVMVTEIRELWTNVYRNSQGHLYTGWNSFDNRESAELNGVKSSNYITTVLVYSEEV